MGWQLALTARLEAAQGVTALVGSRVYWIERPQGSALPAITLTTISDAMDQHLKDFESLQPARCQIDVWAPTYEVARQITDAVIEAVVPPHTGNGIKFTRAMVDLAPRDMAERSAAPDGKNKIVFRTTTDLIFNHAIAEEEES